MPRPQAIPDELRAEIERRILTENQTHADVLHWLAGEGYVCQRHTLLRRCKEWGISRRGLGDDPVVLEYIDKQFHTTLDNDNKIATHLASLGYSVLASTVKEIRLAHGWRHRSVNDQQKDQQWEETYRLVDQALEEGTARSYGRERLQTSLRQQGHRATEDHVRAALKKLDEKGSDSRKPGMKRKRELKVPIIPGPNHLWSIDGHDKFRNYGIEIYAGIDAYSRRIQWIYCGNSNRTQASVARQYLETVATLGIRPRFLRSDKGSETSLTADAQYSFYKKQKRAEGLSEEDLANLPLRGCYWFGSSTSNVKIEAWWRQLIAGQTLPWMEYFQFLVAQGLYESDLIADRVVLQFVFIPILRRELRHFVNVHNEHRIRADTSRPDHVRGRPNNLYEGPSTQPDCGIPPDLDLLDQLQTKLETWDFDAYLSDATLAWCDHAINGHSPSANEFLSRDRQRTIPAWYRDLVHLARGHVQGGQDPVFQFAPKPRKTDGWVIEQRVVSELNNNVDTFGLAEQDSGSETE